MLLEYHLKKKSMAQIFEFHLFWRVCFQLLRTQKLKKFYLCSFLDLLCFVSGLLIWDLMNRTRKPTPDLYRHVQKHCRRRGCISKLQLIFIFKPLDIGQ